ncbi:MAG: hypothetical protein AAF591_13055 [Verrucomicrobiota bacterium]
MKFDSTQDNLDNTNGNMGTRAPVGDRDPNEPVAPPLPKLQGLVDNNNADLDSSEPVVPRLPRL